MKLQYITRKNTSLVEFRRDQHCSLGISVTECQKDIGRPVIKSIKPGSLAHRSHSVAEGDVILSINGLDSRGMRKKDVKRLFRETTNPLLDVKVGYSTREACFGHCRIYCSQRLFMTLKKESGSYGFVLRKNDSMHATEYPVISNIKHGGPADKEGSMMAGDRLLEVDNQSLSWLSLTDATTLLKGKDEAVFLIEYNVGIVDLSRQKEIEIEIDCLDTNLGMTVASSAKDCTQMVIASIQQGSLAQRCGGFHVGDEILAIDDVDVKDLTTFKANDILRRFRKRLGKLTLVHKAEKSAQIPEDIFTHDVLKTNNSPDHSIKGHEKQLQGKPPSNDVPPNSPASSCYGPIHEKIFFQNSETDHGYDDCQLKTLSILRHINLNVANLMLSLSQSDIHSTNTQLDINNVDDSHYQWETSTMPRQHDVGNAEVLSQLNAQCMLIKNLTRELTIHAIMNTAQLVERRQKNLSKTFHEDIPDNLSDSGGVVLELIDHLNEIATQRFAPKTAVERFMESVSKIDTNCSKCREKCYSASFAVRKALLLLSLGSSSPYLECIIRRVMDKVVRLRIPCKLCQKPWSTSSEEIQKNDFIHDLDIPRTWGVGASRNSSISSQKTDGQESQTGTFDLQANKESYIRIDIAQQTAMYRLTEVSDKTNEDKYSKENGDANDIHQHSPSVRLPLNVNGPQVTVINLEDKLTENITKKYQNELEKNEGLPSKISRNWKSSDVITQLRKDLESSLPSVRPKSTFAEYPILRPSSPNQRHNDNNRSSYGLDFTGEFCHGYDPSAGPSHYGNQSFSSKDQNSRKTHTETMEVKLKSDGMGFGLVLGYNSLAMEGTKHVPIITSIKPKSVAERIGVLKKGDKIVAINGHTTINSSVVELEVLKRETFSLNEIAMKVEFDVYEPDIVWGTFEMRLDYNLKPGLVMDEPNCPSIVKGLIKGSSAHRSGQVFPGDEILSLSSIWQENLDLQCWSLTKNKDYILAVRREVANHHPKMKRSPEYLCDPVSIIRSGAHFNIKRTSIRTMAGLEGSERIVLEQEFVLFRDPQTWDFGFLFGENPRTGKAFVTDIRPGGPADNSKAIKKYDRIVEVNGIIIDGNVENSIMNLLMNAKDCISLLTRRTLHYK